MKKFLISIVAVLMLATSAFAGHGGGGGGGRGGYGCGPRPYYHGGGGYYRGYNGNAFWGSFSGAAAGAFVAGILTQPQQVTYVQPVAVAQPIYVAQRVVVNTNVNCLRCNTYLSVTNVMPGTQVQCPACEYLMTIN